MRRPTIAWLAVICMFLGGGPVRAAQQTVNAAADTFINASAPDNNLGGSDSIFVGNNPDGGMLRGLIRFDMPAGLSGRVTVTGSPMTLFYRDVPDPTKRVDAILSLRPLSVGWGEGTGANDALGSRIIGVPCTGSGASWNHPECTTGTWPAISAVSGTASTFGKVDGSSVEFNGAAMNNDVQNWMDAPSGNNGWLITSNTESAVGSGPHAQRFYSTESGNASFLPKLKITYECKAGLLAVGDSCTTCTDAANAACVTSAGNLCVDSGPPSTSYACMCDNPGYVAGPGFTSCLPRFTVTPSAGAHGTISPDMPQAVGQGQTTRFTVTPSTGYSSLMLGSCGGSLNGTTYTTAAINADCTVIASFVGILDIDANGRYDPLTDGLLVIRYFLQLRGAALIAHGLGQKAFRDTAPEVEALVAGLGLILDVDQNGKLEAENDGLMILRYLFGLRGDAVTADAIGHDAKRNSAQINAYIQTLMP